MIDPKYFKHGFLYIKSPRRDRPYDIVEVSLRGEVYMIGSDVDHVVYEPDLEFIAPVPPPPIEIKTKTAAP